MLVLAAAACMAGSMGFAQSSGEAVYKANCQSCHGSSGTPSPGIAKMMGVKAASDPDIKKLSAEEGIRFGQERQGQDEALQRQAHRCTDQGCCYVFPLIEVGIAARFGGGPLLLPLGGICVSVSEIPRKLGTAGAVFWQQSDQPRRRRHHHCVRRDHDRLLAGGADRPSQRRIHIWGSFSS